MLDRKNIWGKTKYWKREFFFFGLCDPEEGRVEENENVYNQLYERLNENNINDYILLSGDVNAIRGNIVGSFVQPVTNTNGSKLRDLAIYNSIK